MNRFKKWSLNHPANFFIIGAICSMCILMAFDFFDDSFSWHDILVEAHGMFYDLIVFGILLSVYEQLKNKKERIERYKEELNDYRGWTENEAAYRINGIMKRLKKENEIDIDYSNLHLGKCSKEVVEHAVLEKKAKIASLENAFLFKANLQHADLSNMKLSGSNLEETNFKSASFRNADMENVNLIGADLEGAFLFMANLENSNLSTANLKNANLRNVNFYRANMTKVKLENAIVSDLDWFHRLKILNVKGVEDLEKKYYVDPTPFDNKWIVTYKIKSKDI